MTYNPRETQMETLAGLGGSSLYMEGLFQADGFQNCHNHPIFQKIIHSTLKSIL